MGSSTTMTVAAMAEQVALGSARPLLAEGTPGPVRLDDHWWAVPDGAVHYVLVTDPQAAARLDSHAQRLLHAHATLTRRAPRTREHR